MNRSRIAALIVLIAGAVSISNGHAQTVTTLYSFSGGADGASPFALIGVGGNLYGQTYEGGAKGLGTVFSVDATTGAKKTVHSFTGGADGAYPDGGLLYADSVLYGTTVIGGAACHRKMGCGTIFSVNPSTGVESIIHAFDGVSHGRYPAAQLIEKNGALFGAFPYEFAKVKIATGFESVIGPDQYPGGSIVFHAGKFYGTNNGQGYGAVFSADPATKQLATLYTFPPPPTPAGSNITGELIYHNGALYGTATSGGTYNSGTIYSFDLATNAVTAVSSFDSSTYGTNGQILFHDNRIFGAIYEGEKYGYGAIYEVNPANGKQTMLYNFANKADGRGPSSLIYQNGTFYGTTQAGGAGGGGTVFELTLNNRR